MKKAFKILTEGQGHPQTIGKEELKLVLQNLTVNSSWSGDEKKICLILSVLADGRERIGMQTVSAACIVTLSQGLCRQENILLHDTAADTQHL